MVLEGVVPRSSTLLRKEWYPGRSSNYRAWHPGQQAATGCIGPPRSEQGKEDFLEAIQEKT